MSPVKGALAQPALELYAADELLAGDALEPLELAVASIIPAISRYDATQVEQAYAQKRKVLPPVSMSSPYRCWAAPAMHVKPRSTEATE